MAPKKQKIQKKGDKSLGSFDLFNPAFSHGVDGRYIQKTKRISCFCMSIPGGFIRFSDEIFTISLCGDECD